MSVDHSVEILSFLRKQSETMQEHTTLFLSTMQKQTEAWNQQGQALKSLLRSSRNS